MRRAEAVKWVCIGVASLAFLGAAFPDGTYPFWKFNIFLPTYEVDYGLDRQRERYAIVLKNVPAAELVGVFSSDMSRKEEMLMQYTLRPRGLVEITPDQRPGWAINVFKESVDAVEFANPEGYEVVARSETGVILFRRRGR